MIIYKGKYPKRINTVYTVDRVVHAVLNDGTIIRPDVVACNYQLPKINTELLPSQYTVVGQSYKRKAQ